MNPRLAFTLLLSVATSIAMADNLKVSGSVSINAGDETPKAASPSAAGKKRNGPPPWAPAHGYRAKFSYRYYPDCEAYYRVNDGVWIYYESGKWSVGVKLPLSIKADVKSFVTLDMDTDKPYTFHEEVKSSYPGKSGEAKGDKGKSKGEGGPGERKKQK